MTVNTSVHLENIVTGCASQGTCHLDEVIGDKRPVVK
jgi:hypothetical protein